MNESLESFAAALSSLTPRSADVNRDRLMYEAGRAAGLKGLVPNRAGVRFWKFTAAFSTVAAACFAMLSMLSFGAKPETIVRQDAPLSTKPNVKQELPAEQRSLVEIAATVRPMNSTYLSQRNLVLAEGIDSLPQYQTLQEGSFSPSATYRELLNSLDELSGFGG